MTYILSREHARKSDSDFTVAAARAIYCDYTLNRMDEKGTTPGGCELTEVLPATQPWAFKLARRFTVECWLRLCLHSRLKQFNGALPPARVALASERLVAYLQSLPGIRPADRERTPDILGWYAAMQAMGHGVGLRECGIDVGRLPHLEAWP